MFIFWGDASAVFPAANPLARWYPERCSRWERHPRAYYLTGAGWYGVGFGAGAGGLVGRVERRWRVCQRLDELAVSARHGYNLRPMNRPRPVSPSGSWMASRPAPSSALR